uniref:PPUP8933 n=1 Tax=Poeciliopsis prolifica TaxID=188132 RepID=A0A0S7ELI3_9TELE
MFVQCFHASHIKIRGALPHVCKNICSNAGANGCRGDPSLDASRSLRANRSTKVMMQGERTKKGIFLFLYIKVRQRGRWAKLALKPRQQRGGWSGAKNNLLRIKTLPSTSPAEVSGADAVKKEKRSRAKRKKKEKRDPAQRG